MDKNEFIKELEKLDIVLTDKQLWQLDKYYKLLIEWNKKINLTRITVEKDVYLKHFYDSVTLKRVVNLCQNLSICDIGTGAGFPGIVLKIVFPTLSITLVDSLFKRVKFLDLVIKELDLKDVIAVHSRGEDFAKLHREEFDIVTSRAVMNLTSLSEISIPLVKVNGYFMPMKANCANELKEVKEILFKLGSEIEMVDEFKLPVENSNRTLIVIKKLKKTNPKYPRSFDKIKKNR